MATGIWRTWRFEVPSERYGTAFHEEGTGGVYYSFDDGPLTRSPHIPQISFLDNDIRRTVAAIGRVLATQEHMVILDVPKMNRGEHYARIWRQAKAPGLAEIYAQEFSLTVQAFRSLYQAALGVFSNIEPDAANNASFGHKIREVLLLACMEVEAGWVAVLRTNGVLQDRYSTNDYVKLLPAMRLDEWRVRLFGWPGYPALSPFSGWNSTNPTRSLPWYDAYNATKHDREQKFSRATLAHMIEAIAAAYIMIEAQFGSPLAYDNAAIGSTPFQILAAPQWPLADQYVPPFTIPNHPSVWTKINHAF